jgi:hypothetical protein
MAIDGLEKTPMSISFIRIKGHSSGSGTFQFVVADGTTEILCAISDEAMDDAEGSRDVGSNERVTQFERLKARAIQCVSRKYNTGQFEPSGPLILISTRDLNV